MPEEVLNQQDGNRNQVVTKDMVEADAANKPMLLSWFKISSKYERAMFWSMAGMFFIIGLVYSVLRDVKDAIVMEEFEGNALSFLKTMFVTPVSIVAVAYIQHLLGSYGPAKIHKLGLMFFGFSFLLFGLVLIPAKYFVTIGVKEWVFDTFSYGTFDYRKLNMLLTITQLFVFPVTTAIYVLTEIYGSIVLSLLFLSLANDKCPFWQYVRFLPVFYIVSNVALMLSGIIMKMLSILVDSVSFFSVRLMFMGIYVAAGLCCFLVLLIQIHLEKNVMPRQQFISGEDSGKKKTKGKKPTLAEAFDELSQSRFLLHMCLHTMCFAIVQFLIDGVGKVSMKDSAGFQNQSIKASVMGKAAINQIVIAFFVILILITPLRSAINMVGMLAVALAVPMFVAVFGMLMFLVSTYNVAAAGESLYKSMENFITTLVPGNQFPVFESYVAMFVISMLKIMKYAAFDMVKEYLVMKIEKDVRPRHKAIFDGVCGKLGKSIGGGIMITYSIVLNTNNPRQTAFLSVFLMSALLIVWFNSAFYLSRKYNECVAKGTDIDLDMSLSPGSKKYAAEGAN